MLPAFTCTVSNIWWASDTLEICHEHEQIQTPYHTHFMNYHISLSRNWLNISANGAAFSPGMDLLLTGVDGVMSGDLTGCLVCLSIRDRCRVGFSLWISGTAECWVRTLLFRIFLLPLAWVCWWLDSNLSDSCFRWTLRVLK